MEPIKNRLFIAFSRFLLFPLQKYNYYSTFATSIPVFLSQTFTKFPECYGCGGSNVQGVDAVSHRDSHHIVRFCYGAVGQSVALSTHDDGQTGFALQWWIVEGNAIVCQSHGRCTETQFM
jgi:hypothetical protein